MRWIAAATWPTSIEKDFYLVTRGEGILAKRNFEA
jgi:hypothetical protein